MARIILIALGLLTSCHGGSFDGKQFVERYCEETGSDLTCSGISFSDDSLMDFANESFTISNARNVHLEGDIRYLNEYLFEKFPEANRLYIQANSSLYLNKPYERQSSNKITSKIVDLVLEAKFYGYRRSSTLNWLASLKTLKVSGYLPEIDEYLLEKNSKLETLIIRTAELQIIAPKAFQNLEKLSKIDLSGNRLLTRSLDRNLFSSQSKLVCIDLSNNLIEFVPMGSFWPSSLVNLDLSSNRISTITKNHFKNLENLASLDLSHNRINVLSRDAFAANTKLIFASIRSNKLNKVQETLFPDQKKLIHFDVSVNKLQDLKNFVGAAGIQYLNASHNQLTGFSGNSFNDSSVILDFSFNKINAVSFPKVDSLRIVYLNNNNIPPIQITKNKLMGVKNLEELHLHSNGMTWIYEDAFDDLEKLEIINY